MRIVLVLFLFFFNFGNSQVKENLTVKQIDSAIKAIDHTVSDNEGENLTFLCTNLYNQSKKLNYIQGQLASLQKLCLYRINAGKEYDQAIADSKTIEELSKSVNDYYFFCLAKMSRSYVFLKMGLTEKSKKLAEDALKDAHLIKNNNLRLEIYANADLVYQCYYENRQEYDKILYYTEKIHKGALMMTDDFVRKSHWLLYSIRVLGNTYFIKGNYKTAGYYLKLQEKYIEKSKLKSDFALYHLLKAEFEFKTKSNKDYINISIHHYKEAEKYFKIINSSAVLDVIYSQLADIYAEKKDLKNQALYLEKSKILKDSINKVQRENYQKVDPNVAKNDLASEFGKINRNYILLSLLTMIGLALFFFFRYRKAKQNDGKNEEEKQKAPISISDLKNFANEPDLFDVNFQRVFPEFYKNLLSINSTLDKSNLQLCAFIKLNFDTKKIATIKNISVRTVENRKYMLRKKLNIAAYEDLYIWMSKI